VSPRRQPADPPLQVTLPDLHPGGLPDLRSGDCDGLAFDGLELPGLVVHDLRLLECRLAGCVLDDARLRGARLSSCVLDGLRATTLDLADSTWLDVVVEGGRYGAVLGQGSQLQRVAVHGVKIDYLNLRGADLNRVEVSDCTIGELDLGTSQARHLRFVRSRVDRLVLHGATLRDVDLTGADLSALEGLQSLRGALISQDQLTQLAAALADSLGIRVTPG
jgi:uncharacterized protein YjbI with pentapeptide repeats